MIAYLIGSACPWVGLIVWMWIAEYQSESWIGSAWSLPRLEYFDVPWILVLILVVPIATAWACGESMRLLRRPRLFDRRAGESLWRRFALGLIVGLVSVALVGVATAYQSEHTCRTWSMWCSR